MQGLRALLSGALTEAVSIDLQNDGVMNEAVNRRDGHHGITKDGMPLTKGLIGRDHDAFTLIAVGNKFKEDGGFGF